MIQPIVEGHGELEAVGVLLRRLIAQAGAFEVQVGRPIRQSRFQLLQEASLKRAARVAQLQGATAILVLLDGDDDCPRDLAPRMERWCNEAAPDALCRVVVAHREYEAWFLAGIEGLRGERGVREDAEAPEDPERHRGAKELLEQRMRFGKRYFPKIDQPAMSERFDLGRAYRRSRSFRRMTSAFGSLLRAEGVSVEVWPPTGWVS